MFCKKLPLVLVISNPERKKIYLKNLIIQLLLAIKLFERIKIIHLEA